MINLDSCFDNEVIANIQEYTNLRFRNVSSLKTPEALVIYEQQYQSDERTKAMCEEAYGIQLYDPIRSYIPQKVIMAFRGTGAVPVQYLPMQHRVVALYLPEIEYRPITMPNACVDYLPTMIYRYLELYQEFYGNHPMLLELPVKLLLRMIVSEGISLGAADITIATTLESRADIYYNVRKTKVKSRRILSCDNIPDIIKYLCIKSPYDFGSKIPKYVDVDLSSDYRARVVINTKMKGYVITMRLLPNKAFDTELTALNLQDHTIQFIRDRMFDSVVGLRLIIGATMSGKNTTALAALREVTADGLMKVVSIEMPVEQHLPGIEQINTETVEEYEANIKSLIHQNPDFVYITEIRDVTGLSTMQICNTGKRVLATLHANSCADVITRLTDITGLSQDRVIQTLHSVLYQELRRDNKTDTVQPYNRFVYFSQEMKNQLYGKSIGEVVKIINSVEEGD